MDGLEALPTSAEVPPRRPTVPDLTTSKPSIAAESNARSSTVSIRVRRPFSDADCHSVCQAWVVTAHATASSSRAWSIARNWSGRHVRVLFGSDIDDGLANLAITVHDRFDDEAKLERLPSFIADISPLGGHRCKRVEDLFEKKRCAVDHHASPQRRALGLALTHGSNH